MGRRAKRRASIGAALIVSISLMATGCGDDDGPDAADATTTATAADDALRAGVGIRTETLVDSSRPTPSSGDQPATDERTLETLVWYPALVDETAAGVVADATPDPSGGPYPLVVFSHGLGGDPENGAAVVDDWVAAGMVVAAPRFPLSRSDAPGGPDGADVVNQPGDVSFVISELLVASADASSPLAGLVNETSIGAAGHSNGAITTLGLTANTCCTDERIDAAIAFAGSAAPFSGGEYAWESAPPLLVVHGTDDQLVSYAEGVGVFNGLPGPKGLLTIEGGDHGSWFGAEATGHDEVATVTTDFLLAHLTDDADAHSRLEAGRSSPDASFVYGPEPGTTVTVPSPATDADRTATVDPSTGLSDGQVVTVTWDGYLPGGTVSVIQCAAGGTEGASLCDLTQGRILQPNPTGAGSIELEIIVGPVGEGTCTAATDDCVVAVNDSGLSDPDATIRIPISLAG